MLLVEASNSSNMLKFFFNCMVTDEGYCVCAEEEGNDGAGNYLKIGRVAA